ncbi:hypothetical protein F4777DRAFT_131269 [Nemania sp. FL0916]|nr:hypothetical protein F4777DRAFT_131269 [Nemania sp. FL0916]
MDDNSDNQQPPADDDDTLDLSDDYSLRTPRSHDDSLFSTLGSADLASPRPLDRNAYSDEDIRIAYEIVVRAQTILTDELTPTSRVPVHALFLAYDEIATQHGLDLAERHISRIMFMMSGDNTQTTLMEKFRAVMAQMNIVLSIEGSSDQDNGRDDAGDHESDNGHHDTVNDEDRPNISVESLDVTREKQLANNVDAFRQRHRVQPSAMAALRQWQDTAHGADDLRILADARREAQLHESVRDKFDLWRAQSARATNAAPEDVPPNAYSRRTERIAIRTYQIFSTQKALVAWRASNRDEHLRNLDAQLLAAQRVRQAQQAQQAQQDYDDDDFKENPQLARLAQRTYRNLALSRAFATWSNRAADEIVKADIATQAYQRNLQASFFGNDGRQRVMDSMRSLLASRLRGGVDSSADQAIAPDTGQPAPSVSAPASGRPTPAVSIPRPGSIPGQSLSSADISARLRPPRRVAANYPLSADTLAAMAAASNDVPSSIAPPPPPNPAPAPAPSSVPAPAPPAPPASVPATLPAQPAPALNSADNSDASDDDQPDARTMLARRHILRMRYFGAWEQHTRDKLDQVEQFREDRQDRQVTRSIIRWRYETLSQQQQAADLKDWFEENRSHQRMANTIPNWRQRARQDADHEERVLRNYADRADYYRKTTKALPVLRNKAQQARQKEQLLERYAERVNYYSRATQALSIWRERAQEAAQVHQLQEHYGERADYYYRTHNTIATWRIKTRERRRERLRDAHLETRRIVKRGMGERCIKQWRQQLEPSHQRYEMMDDALAAAIDDRDWRQASQAFNTWRQRAQELSTAAAVGDDMLTQKALRQWRARAAVHRDLEAGAVDYWETNMKSRAVKNWNLSSIQSANRPEMVANALDKKDRRLLRQGFETWHARTVDMLVPVQLPHRPHNRNAGPVVQDAQQQPADNRAWGFFQTWRNTAANNRPDQGQEDAYAPTPGRPQLFPGSFGRGQSTTPLAPLPFRRRQQARNSAMGRSEPAVGDDDDGDDDGYDDGDDDDGGPPRGNRNTRRNRNLRVSWAN